MKVAFTTSGKDLNAELDRRFGRAPRFLVCDTESGTFEVVENQQNLNAAQGAGIQAAQALVETGAKAVVTGHCGPKAFRVLEAADIKVYHASVATIEEALTLYREGRLSESTGPNVVGHWV